MDAVTNNLTKGSILRTLITFAVPFLFANILQSLYGAADLFVVGRFCGPSAVAAVSTGTQVTQIITSLVTGLTLGGTILTGKYTGMDRPDMVRKSIGTTLTVFAWTAVLLTFLMLFFLEPVLTLLNTPAEAFSLTAQYVSICAMGNIFICGYNAISAVLRGCGDSTRPMFFVGIACVINIILDFILVGGFNAGVSGTALATVISQGISMILAIIWLKRHNFIFDFRLKSFRIDRTLAKELALTGIPVSFQEMMVRISFLYLTAVMNSSGVYAASIVGISSKYDIFAMLPAVSMANALAAITAQNAGAGKIPRALKSLWCGTGFALGIAVLFWLWAQISPESMISAFNDDPEVIATGIPFFRTCSYDYLMVTLVFCLNGYLNGRSKTLWTMVSCTFGALCLRLPLVWLCTKISCGDMGLLGTVAPAVSFIMAVYTGVYVLYEGRKWRKRKNGK